MSKAIERTRPENNFSITLNDDGTETVEDFGKPLVEQLPDSLLMPFIELVHEKVRLDNEVASLSLAA